MAKSFTYCWQHDEVLRHGAGEPVSTAYGSQFSRRGVCPGDTVYIVSVRRGRLFLLGKMLVGAVVKSAADFRRLTGMDPEPAQEYLVAEAFTPGRLVELSTEQTQALRFLRGKSLVGLSLREESLVNRQSLRSVRRLNAASAAALDELLPALQSFHPRRQ